MLPGKTLQHDCHTSVEAMLPEITLQHGQYYHQANFEEMIPEETLQCDCHSTFGAMIPGEKLHVVSIC